MSVQTSKPNLQSLEKEGMDELSLWFPEEELDDIMTFVSFAYPDAGETPPAASSLPGLTELLAPLIIGRTLQLLSRRDGSQLPVPSMLARARIATFQGSCDRITETSFAPLSALFLHWEQTQSKEVARRWVVLATLLAVLMQARYVQRLFTQPAVLLLETRDIDGLIAQLRRWHEEDGAFMRSRFQPISFERMKGVLATLASQSTSLPPEPLSLSEFSSWIVGICAGIGPFYALVIGKELAFHQRLQSIGPVTRLQSNQGSFKLLRRFCDGQWSSSQQQPTLIAREFDAIRRCWYSAIRRSWSNFVRKHGEEFRASFEERVRQLCCRLPTDIEIENYLCEANKTLKVMAICLGRISGSFKLFDGEARPSPLLTHVPLLKFRRDHVVEVSFVDVSVKRCCRLGWCSADGGDGAAAGGSAGGSAGGGSAGGSAGGGSAWHTASHGGASDGGNDAGASHDIIDLTMPVDSDSDSDGHHGSAIDPVDSDSNSEDLHMSFDSLSTQHGFQLGQ